MDKVASKIENFFSKYSLRKFENNQILIQAGENPKYVYYLQNGMVRQYDISNSGNEVVVNVFKEKSFLPLTWVVNRTDNQYFYDCLGQVEARLAPADEVLNFIKSDSEISFSLLSRLLSGSAGLQRRMAHLMASSGYIRVLFELTIECKRFGEKQKNGGYLLKIHENELAKRSGLSRETVSHELNKLKKLNLVEVGRKDILIKNLAAIEDDLGNNL